MARRGLISILPLIVLLGLPIASWPHAAIGVVKKAAQGWSGEVQGIVTAVIADSNTFVVEQEDRSAAITVSGIPSATPYVGQEVVVSGTKLSDGRLMMQSVAPTGRDGVLVRPIGVSNKSIVGALGEPGLQNLDMLVETWGTVLDAPTTYFDGSVRYHITDGSPASAECLGASTFLESMATAPATGFAPTATQVILPPTLSRNATPNAGDFVVVAGIAGKSYSGDKPVRAVTVIPPAPLKMKYPRVVVAWDGSGDFGPSTPGTATDGIQEAINYCVQNGQDLYVMGGWKGPVYHIRDTIRIPPAANFRIDSGLGVLNYEGPADRDMICIDSARNCFYTFGVLVYGGQQSILRIKPVTAVPGDTVAQFRSSEVRASSLADPTPFSPGPRTGTGGVVFDTASGSIRNNDFYFTAILNFNKCVVMTQSDSVESFSSNDFKCINLHTNATGGTLLCVGPKASQNTIQASIGVDQGAAGVYGALVSGSNNYVDLSVRTGFTILSRTLTFDTAASGNTVNLIETASDVKTLLTDNAASPTNCLKWTGAPNGVLQLTVPYGTYSYTQKWYPSVARLTGNPPSSIKLWRNGAYVSRSPAPPEINLSVGDRLELVTSKLAVLRVTPIKQE